MFELIIFIISCFFVYIILGNLIIKIKGDKLGCISFSFTIFISILFSLSISKKLNPNKAETFFFREQITKKTDDYKSNYQLNNKDYYIQILPPILSPNFDNIIALKIALMGIRNEIEEFFVLLDVQKK